MPGASSSYHIKHFKLNILVRTCFYWLCLSFTPLTIQYGILLYLEFSLKWPYWPKSEVKQIFYLLTRSSTFRPHPGRVIGDLFRQLHAVRHGTEALVCSNHPKAGLGSITIDDYDYDYMSFLFIDYYYDYDY